MAKTETTIKLEETIQHETSKQGTFGCFEVTIGWYGEERVDYITYNTKGEWRCYEVKCSIADFHSKAKKTFIGHYNYYVMTKELYEAVKEEIPKHIGVYVFGTLVKKPRKQILSIDEQILKDSMIRSLYRDAKKLYDNGNENLVGKLRNSIAKLEKEKRTEISDYRTLCNKLYQKFGRKWREDLGIE